jgi:hypothetical protein
MRGFLAITQDAHLMSGCQLLKDRRALNFGSFAAGIKRSYGGGTGNLFPNLA